MALKEKTASLLAIVVAVAAVASIAASVAVVKQSNRLHSIENRIGSGSVEQVAAEADNDADNRHFALTSEDKTVRINGVVTRKGAAFLNGGDAKKASEGRSYQLWAETPAGQVSLGVLGDDATDVFAFRLPEGAQRLQITNEPSSGAATPSAEVLVVGTVPAFS